MPITNPNSTFATVTLRTRVAEDHHLATVLSVVVLSSP